MKCPRCNYEWDVRQSPCPQCRLSIRMPARSSVPNRLVPINEARSQESVSLPLQRKNQLLAGPQSDAGEGKSTQISVSTYPDFPQPSKSLATDRLGPKRIIPALSSASAVSKTTDSLISPSWSGLSSVAEAFSSDTASLAVGTMLQRGRYCLQQVIQKQQWPLGVVETIWSALDARSSNTTVIIHELSIPDNSVPELQNLPYIATKVFTSIGRHPYMLPLRDVFSDKGHNFFVFEPASGVSLATLMSKNGGKFTEKETITCCLQIVDLLNTCFQQTPALVHGNIQPDAILKKSTDDQYVLTQFSVALAGGLAHIVTEMQKVSQSPIKGMELVKGKVDGRVDLSMLLAMAYYMITGYRLSDTNTMVSGFEISPTFRAIFMKGVRAPLQQRYQTPVELYQDLFALQTELASSGFAHRSTIAKANTQPFPSVAQMNNSQTVSNNFNIPIQLLEEQSEHTILAPLPEELPPFKEAHDLRNAILWFAGMLLGFLLLLGRGFV